MAAAFIGPGTVTICTLAGVNHGFSLLWALLFSTLATILLQEMAARLGIVSKAGLGEALRDNMVQPVGKWISAILVLSAILIGNAAYEAGNISGAALGVSYFSLGGTNVIALLIGLVAFVLLYIGVYKIIERFLVVMVILMSVCFLLTALLSGPDWASLFKGLLIPSIPDGSLLTVIGLIGTTIVPYNLFLHASIVNEKWNDASISDVRWDTMVSIGLGGIVSMCIIISGAAIIGGEVTSAADLSRGLVPLLGDYAGVTIAIGLCAAGLTSAITAPLAAAYATCGILGWSKDMKSFKFRAIWAIILIIGVTFSMLGIKPIEVIKFAQIANGLLLPFIAIFLIWAVNQPKIMGDHKNTLWQNILGYSVMAVCLGLGIYTILK